MLLNSGQVLTERAKIGPRAEAIVDAASGARCDFRQLNERANQTANTLLAMDFRPGERIACLMPNQSKYLESL
jgi:acyl-CoA synthetase (AMP-forming)/AMP-acid ligase II